eukprot:COSAG01_NODE_48715_length_378_cov_3.473118_1_plen_79_part_01
MLKSRFPLPPSSSPPAEQSSQQPRSGRTRVSALVRSPTERCGAAVHGRSRRLGRRGCTGSRAPCAAAQRGVLVGSAWSR